MNRGRYFNYSQFSQYPFVNNIKMLIKNCVDVIRSRIVSWRIIFSIEQEVNLSVEQQQVVQSYKDRVKCEILMLYSDLLVIRLSFYDFF